MTEQHSVSGVMIDVRREDLRVGPPFIPHGKTQSLIKMFDHLNRLGILRVACFASRGSDWTLNAAICASQRAMPFTIYSAKGRFVPDFLDKASSYATLAFVRGNFTKVNITQAQKLAHANNDFFIPFGLDLGVVGDDLTARLRGLTQTATIVVSAGSGVTLMCLLNAALEDKKQFKEVVAITSGSSPETIIKRLDARIGRLRIVQACEKLTLIKPSEYGPCEDAVHSPWPTHPFYERKAYAWLEQHISELAQPITFINM